MKTVSVHIAKPSNRLINNLIKLRDQKEERKEKLRSEWTKYFPKK